MTRTVYVIERVVLDVGDPGNQPANFHTWMGSNCDHIARLPVAVFADPAAAEADAARREAEVWQAVSPARFGSVLPEPRHSAVRAALCRHGFDPPEFCRWDETAGYVGVSFPDWWAAQSPALSPAAVAEVSAAFASEISIYRVEARELVED